MMNKLIGILASALAFASCTYYPYTSRFEAHYWGNPPHCNQVYYAPVQPIIPITVFRPCYRPVYHLTSYRPVHHRTVYHVTTCRHIHHSSHCTIRHHHR